MNCIKGRIERIQIRKEGFELLLSTESGNVLFTTPKEILYLKKGLRVCISDPLVKKSLLRTTYESKENTILTVFPKFIVYEHELRLAFSCSYAPVIFETVSKIPPENDYEKKFMEAVRGLKLNVQFLNIAERFSKDIKGKFMFKPYEFSLDYGLFVRSALYLGKLPVVFKGNEMKAKMQCVISGSERFVVIDQETSTMKEVEFTGAEKAKLIDVRNRFVLSLKNFDFKEFLSIECKPECPAFQICASVKEIREEEFASLYSAFIKEMQHERKNLIVLLSRDTGHKKSEVTLFSGQAKDFEIEGKIKDNEPVLKEGAEVLVVEKPPLDRKTFGRVTEVSFNSVKGVIDWPIVSPDALIRIESKKYVYPGVVRYMIAKTPVRDYFEEGKLSEIQIPEHAYIDNDPSQNRALNLILSEPSVALIKGEHGTGKKYVVLKALEQLLKNGKTSLILTDTRLEEFQEFFNGLSKVISTSEDSIYFDESEYDYLFMFLVRDISELEIKSYLGIARNIVFLSNADIRFLKGIDFSRVVELNREHRFGSKILHFVSPIFSYKVDGEGDSLIKIMNRDNIDAEFISVINPEKIVQFVEVKGEPKGNRNKWNENEAMVCVEVIEQFIRAGVERRSIGVVVPYERQQKLILKMLSDEKVDGISVKEVLEAPEKDIVLVSLVDEVMLDSPFKDTDLLKFALTRARSKLLIVGGKKITKGSIALQKLIAK